MRVALIIPTWNEASRIAEALDRARLQQPDELVVADGSSPDGTALRARACPGVCVVSTPRGLGRGVQQNAAARQTTSPLLVFLHADCRLAPGALECARRFFARHPRVPAACFRMRVDARRWAYRAIEAGGHLRAGLLQTPYGDQGLCVPRWAFDAVDGFPPTRLLDDLILARRLARLGRIALLGATIHVSDRRWSARGIVRQTLQNWRLVARWASGVHPDHLARYYPAVRDTPLPHAETPP